MKLNDAQQQFLYSPLRPDRVASRSVQGRQLSYLEASDVKRHLIRVFGIGGFSTEVVDCALAFEQTKPNSKGAGDNWNVGYRVVMRLTLHPEEGVYPSYTEAAVGFASLPDRGEAHDMAMKGLALDTPLATPTGWTTMEHIQVGDQVFGRDGYPATVTSKSEVKHLPCYQVTFRNGDSLVCDDEHLWVATVGQESEKVHPVAYLAESKAAGKPVRVPVAAPVQLPVLSLPLDPYVFGLWLGDGSATDARVTANARDIDHYEAAMRRAGIEPGKRQHSHGAFTVSMLGQRKVLSEMGALGDKSIPSAYLRGSEGQRRALLAGLMDSDGTSSRKRVSFTAKREAHARAVAELAWSLGERARVWSGQRTGFGVTGTYWFVEWTPMVNPFTLPRKRAKVADRVKAGWNGVRSILPVASVPTACIAVDSPDRTYLAGPSLIPTHNTAESDALKRCAVYLGTQFGLSLYFGGTKNDVVGRSLIDGVPTPEPDVPPADPEHPNTDVQISEPADETIDKAVKALSGAGMVAPPEERTDEEYTTWMGQLRAQALNADNSIRVPQVMGLKAQAVREFGDGFLDTLVTIKGNVMTHRQLCDMVATGQFLEGAKA